MGTKNNEKPHDCYHKAEPDEPMFILLGRDKHAPQLVELWAGQRAGEGEDPAKVEEALKCAKAMRKWRYDRKGAPSCEYCEAGGGESGCTKESKKLVSENGFLWWYWCGGPETFLAMRASYSKDTVFMTIEEYFATEDVQNEYCQDEGLRVYHETKAMRARANEAVMGDEPETVFVFRIALDRQAEMSPEICQYRTEHEPGTLKPLGPACGKPATRMIHWQDGRMSPCCSDHGSNALTEEALKLVVKIEPIDKL
jgi:hypothetical protein